MTTDNPQESVTGEAEMKSWEESTRNVSPEQVKYLGERLVDLLLIDLAGLQHVLTTLPPDRVRPILAVLIDRVGRVVGECSTFCQFGCDPQGYF